MGRIFIFGQETENSYHRLFRGDKIGKKSEHRSQ